MQLLNVSMTDSDFVQLLMRLKLSTGPRRGDETRWEGGGGGGEARQRDETRRDDGKEEGA